MKAPARLYCLLAREARVGVVFRRGPSRQVLLVQWDLSKDRFREGQWFKGRIYERRCDLSPFGDKLIYFAATYKAPHYSWTAISKPPWFTAAAWWSKGDGWNGGGYFLTQKDVVLNAPWKDLVLQPGSDTRGFKVAGYVEQKGEDAPTHHYLLQRSGWKCLQPGVWNKYSVTKGWVADAPETWTKKHPSRALFLHMECHGIGRRNQGWYDLRHHVQDVNGQILFDLGKSDWAEWDTTGDLLFAREGCLYRATTSRRSINEPTLLVDLNDRVFRSVTPPEEAKRW